jgi:hypothetical protein
MMSASGTVDRLYLCPRCGSPEPAPATGGAVTCSRCQTPSSLPDRTALFAGAGGAQEPSNDPTRLAQLRIQDGRPRQVPPTLQAVLGGQQIQPGREQEALAIWQSLRARAQAGDVSASEDLSVLTLLLAQLPSMQQQPALSQALSEGALDAAVLPRHRQEQLGRLGRLAASQGYRARALSLLAGMIPNAPELETDSEHRVTTAVVATLDRDGHRVLALLGPQKDVVPIADSLDPLASVLRANAYELVGNAPVACQILRELPDPGLLPLVQGRFPALRLCAQSAAVYAAATGQESAQRAAESAGGVGTLIGGIFGAVGLLLLGVGVLIVTQASRADLVGGLIPLGLGTVFFVAGLAQFVRGRAQGKHAAWLRMNGLACTARVTNASPTGVLINHVPVYLFTLQVNGPQGPYSASFKKLAREHEVGMILGREVRVRANPTELTDLILEE